MSHASSVAYLALALIITLLWWEVMDAVVPRVQPDSAALVIALGGLVAMIWIALEAVARRKS